MPRRTITPSFGDCFRTSLKRSTISLTWPAGLIPQRGPISAIRARGSSGISGNFEFLRVLPQTVFSNGDADELDLRELLDRVAHAFASDAALFHSAERIVVEPKTGRFVDPERADFEIVRKPQSCGRGLG